MGTRKPGAHGHPQLLGTLCQTATDINKTILMNAFGSNLRYAVVVAILFYNRKWIILFYNRLVLYESE